MRLAHSRRLTLILTVFGILLPAVPYLLGFPHDGTCDFNGHIGTPQCALLGLAAMAFALVLQKRNPLRRPSSSTSALGLSISLLAVYALLLPLWGNVLPRWYWDALR